MASGYQQPETIPEQSIALGSPSSGMQTQSGGVRVRRFAHAFVAVNPTLSSVTVSTPNGSVSMAPRSGLVTSLG